MPACQIIHSGKKYDFTDLESAQDFLDGLPSPRGELEILGAPRLFQLLNEIGAPMYNWREINEEICNEWKNSFEEPHNERKYWRDKERRIGLLETFQAVMDIAEGSIDPDDLKLFRETREKQYKTFIYQESMVGQNVCVESLYAITQREIDAGRMPSDHSCRRLAEEGVSSPHLTRAELITQCDLGELTPAPQATAKQTIGEKLSSWLFGAGSNR
jgi:hypothetical protein